MNDCGNGESADAKLDAQGLGRLALFLAWSPPSHTRRSELMARRLGIPLRRVHVLRKGRLTPVRYALQALLTWGTLFHERPRAVLVQNPPIFASLCAWLYCALTQSTLIIDSHTDALKGRIWQWSLPLHRFLSRRAKATMVTNPYLAQLVQGWGARSQIVVDVPSELPMGMPYPVGHPFNIAMVSSFAPDEPLEEVTRAAEGLPDVGFYVTGDPKWGSGHLPPRPMNVHLTGFLSDDDYYGLLRSVQAVMALTTEDHTMQRGACEAVWLGQPIITSDWPVLRQAFHKGAVHSDNSTEGIRAAIIEMRARHQELTQEVLVLQQERQQQWEQVVQELQAMLVTSSGKQAGQGNSHELP